MSWTPKLSPCSESWRTTKRTGSHPDGCRPSGQGQNKTLSAIEATRSKLRQQQDAADREEAPNVASDTEAHNREVAASLAPVGLDQQNFGRYKYDLILALRSQIGEYLREKFYRHAF